MLINKVINIFYYNFLLKLLMNFQRDLQIFIVLKSFMIEKFSTIIKIKRKKFRIFIFENLRS